MPPVPDSPLTSLRKAAPGSLTLGAIRERMTRFGCARSVPQLSRFENGLVDAPSGEFVRAYARAIGVNAGKVERAFQRLRREQRRKKTCLTRAVAAA